MSEKIILGECIKEMSKLKDNSIDMIFADPPYNLQLSKALLRPDQTNVKGVNHDWDKFNSFDSYDEFTKNWLKQSKRILKDNGTIWVIGSYHNIFRVGTAIQNLGFWILNDIIWNKTNPMPNFKGNRFTNAHETIIWASKSKTSKYTFNYKAMKVSNDDKQMRSDWSLPICSGNERIKKLGKSLHPTQKPESLLHRIILSSTKPGDKILDPFFGTGSTGVVSKRLRRKFIGIEENKEYIKYAKKRIKNTNKLKEEELNITKNPKSEIKVPFGNLLDNGLLEIGSKLHDINKKHKAVIRADGSLLADKKFEGSIHKVGAKLQGHNACNGWQYWHYEKHGKLISINTLREKIRNSKKITN
jgi:modification methylase